MKHLFLSLHDTDPDAPIEHVALDADGRLLEHGRSTLAELAPRVRDAIVHAVIPARDVAHFTVRLPPMAASKVRASLPYALEDQLLEECDALHFAYDDTAKGKEPRELAVATINRARLRTWVERLQAAGIAPRAIHSEQSILLARAPGPITMCLPGERVLCARPPTATLEIERARLGGNFATWLALLEREGGSEGPISVELVGDRDALALTRPVLEALAATGRTILREEREAHWFHWLAATALLVEPINLLQGEFAVQEPKRLPWQGWRLPVSLAAVLLALVIVDFSIQRVSPVPPADTPTIDAPEVDAFYGLLESLALAGRGANLKLEQVRFTVDQEQGERVELRARLATDDEVKSLISALEARGWRVESRATGTAEPIELVLTRGAGVTSESMRYATTQEIQAWLDAEETARSTEPASALTLTTATAEAPVRVLVSGTFAALLPLLERLPERGLAAAAVELRLAQGPGLVDGSLTLYRVP